MKVNDPSGNLGAGAAGLSGLNRSQEATPSGLSSKIRGGQSGRGDQVSLSNLSSSLSAQQADSPQHVARLAQLSADVSSGRYSVDPYTVSSSIIQQSLRA